MFEPPPQWTVPAKFFVPGILIYSALCLAYSLRVIRFIGDATLKDYFENPQRP